MPRIATRIPRPSGSTVAAAVAYLLVAVVFTRPLARHLTDRMVLFSGDSMLNAYLVAWVQHALLHDPLALFHPNFLFPMPHAIALSENLVLPALLSLPFAAGGNPVLVYDVLFLTSFPLSAFALFLVLRRWGVGALAAGAGGLLFGYLPWRYGQLGHAQLLFTWWIPPALAAADAWLHRGGTRAALAAGAGLAAGFYACVYEFYFLALFVGAYAVVLLVLRGRRGELRPADVPRRLREAALGAVVALALLAPAVPSYRAVSEWLHQPNSLEFLANRGASVTDYLRAPTVNALWGEVLGSFEHAYSDVRWEHDIFPGFLAILLAAAYPGLARRRRASSPASGGDDGHRDRAIAVAAGAALLFLVSLGPVVHVGARALGPNPVYVALYHALPGFDALRVPPRAALFVGLGLAILAAFALDALRRRALVLVAIALLLAELAPDPLPVETSEAYARHRAVMEELAARPPGTVLVLPLDDATNYVAPLASTTHFPPLVNGISGYLPPSTGAVFDRLRERPWGDAQRDLLRWLDVRWVVLDLVQDPDGGARAEEIAAGLVAAGELAGRRDLPGIGMTVLERRSEGPAAAAGALALDLFHTGGGPDGGPIHLWMRNAGGTRRIGDRPRHLDVEARAFSADGRPLERRGDRVVLPPFWVAGQDIAWRVPVPSDPDRARDTVRLEIEVAAPGLVEPPRTITIPR